MNNQNAKLNITQTHDCSSPVSVISPESLQECLRNVLSEYNIESKNTLLNNETMQSYINQHKYKISQAKDGRWITHVTDSTKPEGRRRIAKRSLEELDSFLIDFYKKQTEIDNYSFQNCFDKWVENQKELVSISTINRYNSDYRRFFVGSSLELKLITKITPYDITHFISEQITKYQLNKIALTNIIGYFNGVLRYAIITHVIDTNPMVYVETNKLRKKCIVKEYQSEERIISDSDIQKLYNELLSDRLKKFDYMQSYAVEFAMYTGMRVGEIVCRKWSDIIDNEICINTSEHRIYEQGKHTKYVIGATKTQKSRKIPLTPQLQTLLDTVRQVQHTIGCESEFIFANNDGRINSNQLNDYTHTRFLHIGLENHNIHSIRRTVSSNLRRLNIPTATIATMLGHTEQVNDACYNYDLTDVQLRIDYLKQATIITK